MRTITYADKAIEVEIISLVLPREAGLMGRAASGLGAAPNLMMLSPLELPLGGLFSLPNATEGQFDFRVVGCAPHLAGRYLVLGVVMG